MPHVVYKQFEFMVCFKINGKIVHNRTKCFPAPSNVSMKSDRSKGDPVSFEEERSHPDPR